MNVTLRLASSGEFEFTESPVPRLPPPNDDWRNEIHAAGFHEELSTSLDDGPEIRVYMRDEKPRFLIDIWGTGLQFAVLVADDAPHFLKTMKEISAVVSLVQASQTSTLRVLGQPEKSFFTPNRRT